MHSIFKWAGRIVGVASIVGLSVIGTRVADLGRSAHAVPLTAGLNGPWEDVTKQFDRRVKDRFVLGSSMRDMAVDLTRQGFHQVDWLYPDSAAHMAVREENNIACNMDAIVVWTANPQGALTSISGKYDEAGCL